MQWMAGFECSTQRRKDGVRLDLLRSTAHDRFALSDYRRCAELGLRTIRDGVRWHRVECAPGRFDWSSWLPMLEAAEAANVSVVWDLFHFGWPDCLNFGDPEFPRRFAEFCAAAAELHFKVSGRPIRACLVNEISFFAWAAGERYFRLSDGASSAAWTKRQLVRCATEAASTLNDTALGWTPFWAEPLIHVAARDSSRSSIRRARERHEGQFEVYDLLMGRKEPELGGYEALVPQIGLNFYPHNQWYFEGATIPMGHHAYMPLSELLVECDKRFGRPLIIAETGAEGSGRSAWLHYVCDEIRDAERREARVDALCLYPVTAYAGWDNSRHCNVGLFGAAASDGRRELFFPLANEVHRQKALFDWQC